jgi:hypothetical protein
MRHYVARARRASESDRLHRIALSAASSIALAILMAACGGPSTTDANLRSAYHICRAFHLPSGTPSGLTLEWVSTTTAGKITRLADRFLGHALVPWDQLPSDRLVANCGFANTTALPSSPTTTCPDGSHVSLVAAPNAGFYVDQQQLWSTDSIEGAASISSPCP